MDMDRSAGERAEDWVEAHVQRERRMVVLARNWRAPGDRRLELDLVCRDGPVLVFVEVRARRLGALVTGVHSLDRRKRLSLLRAARAYRRALAGRWPIVRLDVAEVGLRGSIPVTLRYHENVTLFSRGSGAG